MGKLLLYKNEKGEKNKYFFMPRSIMISSYKFHKTASKMFTGQKSLKRLCSQGLGPDYLQMVPIR